jgi:hypothetical protein
LLSASELHARGHFVNSPSDTAPILGEKTKDTDDDPKDKSYQPPKCSNALDDEAPKCIYASDGEEVTSETEFGRELVGRKQNLKRPVILYILTLISERIGKRKSARLITNQKANHRKRKFQ